MGNSFIQEINGSSRQTVGIADQSATILTAANIKQKQKQIVETMTQEESIRDVGFKSESVGER